MNESVQIRFPKFTDPERPVHGKFAALISASSRITFLDASFMVDGSPVRVDVRKAVQRGEREGRDRMWWIFIDSGIVDDETHMCSLTVYGRYHERLRNGETDDALRNTDPATKTFHLMNRRREKEMVIDPEIFYPEEYHDMASELDYFVSYGTRDPQGYPVVYGVIKPPGMGDIEALSVSDNNEDFWAMYFDLTSLASGMTDIDLKVENGNQIADTRDYLQVT